MIILSIVTPTIAARAEQLSKLHRAVSESIADARAIGTVEHLVLDDDPALPKLTIGAKRDRLIREARGKYVAFVDDDDEIHPFYVAEILKAAEHDPDVITFHQEAVVNGEVGYIAFHLGSPNEPFAAGQVIRRNAWHVCAWRRDIAILSQFPSNNYGEDWAWAAPLCAIPGLREVHIPKVLHFYRHSSETTAAPAPTQ